MHTLYALFGAPEDVAFDHTYTRKPYQQLLSWIRCAEAMLRRLLLIEAAAFPKPNTRPLLHEKRQRVRKLREFTHDKPEAWRVSFRCFHGAPASHRRRVGVDEKTAGETPALHKKRLFSAWPLAERYEAILRVYNNPEPYARRLAQRLHAVPHRAREMLRAPPEAEHRVERYEALTHSADVAWPRCDNTS